MSGHYKALWSAQSSSDILWVFARLCQSAQVRVRLWKSEQDAKCPLCELKDDDQIHLLECIMTKIKSPVFLENIKKCKYEDILSNDLQKMNNVAEMLVQAMRVRKCLLQK